MVLVGGRYDRGWLPMLVVGLLSVDVDVDVDWS